MKQQKDNWVKILFSFAAPCKGKMALSVFCAILSVAGGFIPFWAVYEILLAFINQNVTLNGILIWCLVGAAGYLLRVACHGISTILAHISAYTILEGIRLKIADRLMKAPLGEVMGRFMAAELSTAGFFGDVDVIVPVPLHPRKQKMRGYNQSECIARGISAVTGIPVDTAYVARMKHTETQTRKSSYERWENVDGIFCLRRADAFARKHVLIIDDVLTTGATTTACADALKEVEGVRISVLTLAVAAS